MTALNRNICVDYLNFEIHQVVSSSAEYNDYKTKQILSPTLVIINSILAFHSPSVLSFHPSLHHTFHHSTCLHVLILTCLCLGSGSGTGSSSGYTQAWLRGEGPSAHAHEGVRLADQSGWIAIGEGLLDDTNNQGVSRVRQVHMTNQCYHLISGSCSQSWQCWSNSLVSTAGRYSQQWQCLQCGILCCGGQVWTNQWPISPLNWPITALLCMLESVSGHPPPASSSQQWWLSTPALELWSGPRDWPRVSQVMVEWGHASWMAATSCVWDMLVCLNPGSSSWLMSRDQLCGSLTPVEMLSLNSSSLLKVLVSWPRSGR